MPHLTANAIGGFIMTASANSCFSSILGLSFCKKAKKNICHIRVCSCECWGVFLRQHCLLITGHRFNIREVDTFCALILGLLAD